jgi:hypothetical protein
MNLQESSKEMVSASELHDVQLKPEFVEAFCKILIKNEGERRALAEILRMIGPEQRLRELQKFFSKVKGASGPHDVRLRPFEFAVAFWKKLVNAVGERRAKHIMHSVMAKKKEGRPGDTPLFVLIYCYIRAWGQRESNEKIARRIFESKPYYVQCESGEVGVVNDWMTEERLLWDETIVKRTPINKGLPALKKQVERVRQWAIEEGILPKVYAPRIYYRDQ